MMKKGMLFETIVVLLLIVLVFALYVMVTTGGPSEQWAVSGVISSPDGYAYGNLLMGDNGTIYTVDGQNIHAIGPDGHVQWSLAIPNVLYGVNVDSWRGQRAVTNNGTVYVVLTPTDYSGRGEMVAISHEGRFLWGKAYSPGDYPWDFWVRNGQLYLLQPDRLAVYYNNGTEVWHLTDLKLAPAIDENGSIYMMKGYNGETIAACEPNGWYDWHKDIWDYGLGGVQPGTFIDPLYNNHTVYVILQGGVLALNQDGSLKWKKAYATGVLLFSSFDDRGNLYLQSGSRVFYVNPDGDETTITYSYEVQNDARQTSVGDDIFYAVHTISAIDNAQSGYPMYMNYNDTVNALAGLSPYDLMYLGNRTLDQLDTIRIDAYSIKTGQQLWNYTLPLRKRSVTLSASNYRGLLAQTYDIDSIQKDNTISLGEWYRSRNISEGTTAVDSSSGTDLMLSDGVLYVNFWSYNYEVPAFFGRVEVHICRRHLCLK